MTMAEAFIILSDVDVLVDIFKGVCFFGSVALLAIAINNSEKE